MAFWLLLASFQPNFAKSLKSHTEKKKSVLVKFNSCVEVFVSQVMAID